MGTDPHLHHTITREETQPWLCHKRKDLLSTTLPNDTKAHWVPRMWSVEWQPSTSRLREYITSPSRSCPWSDLPKPGSNSIGYALESGVSMLICGDVGLSKSPACDCGADQQTENLIITEFPLYRPPNGLHGLIDVDADASNSWVATEQVPRDLTISFWSFGFTRKKKKNWKCPVIRLITA